MDEVRANQGAVQIVERGRLRGRGESLVRQASLSQIIAARRFPTGGHRHPPPEKAALAGALAACKWRVVRAESRVLAYHPGACG